jgi:probable addiction module antidote protein
MKEATPFDISEYLDSDEKIAAYLSSVMEDNDTALLIAAIGHVARAKGMAQIAKESGLGRESLYKSFAENSQPKFDTVMRVLRALGISLNFSAVPNGSEDPIPNGPTRPAKPVKRRSAPKAIA